MDQNGPFWPEEVHLGPFRSALFTLAIPEPLFSRVIFEHLKNSFRNKNNLFRRLSLLVTFLLVTFSWLFRGFSVAFAWLLSAWKNSVWAFFVAFPWLFRGPNLGTFYAYSP